MLGLGGLFIAVVMIFPNGLAGIYADYVAPRISKLFKKTSGGDLPGSANTPAE